MYINHTSKNIPQVNKSWGNNLLKTYLIFLLCVSIVPKINYLSRILFLDFKTEIVYGLMLGLILINIKMIKYQTKLVLISFFWVLYIIVIAFVARDYYYQLYSPTAIIIILYSYFHIIIFNPRNNHMFKMVAVVFLIISVITAVFGIRALIIDPFISRYLASGNMETFNYYSKLGAVSYDYIYGFVIISPILIGQYFSKKNGKKVKLLILISFISNSLLLFMANYTMAIILYGSGIIFTLMFKVKNKVLSSLMVILGMMFFLIIDIRTVINVIFNKFIPIFEPIIPRYTFNKIMSINNIISNNELSGTINIRYEKLIQNLNIFEESPLFGNALLEGMRVGEHAEFFDVLASGGLIGFIIYISLIMYILLRIYRLYESNYHKPFILSSMIMIFLIGISNNLFRAANIPLFVFVILPSLAFLGRNESMKDIKQEFSRRKA